MNCHNLNEAQLATYKLQHTPGCTVQDSAAPGRSWSRVILLFPHIIRSKSLVVWVHKKSIGNCITIFCTVFAGIMLQSRDMKVRVVMFIFSTQSSPTTQVTRPRQIMETILAASRPSMSQYYVTILCHDNITQQHEVSRSHDPPARLTKVY